MGPLVSLVPAQHLLQTHSVQAAWAMLAVEAGVTDGPGVCSVWCCIRDGAHTCVLFILVSQMML